MLIDKGSNKDPGVKGWIPRTIVYGNVLKSKERIVLFASCLQEKSTYREKPCKCLIFKWAPGHDPGNP